MMELSTHFYKAPILFLKVVFCSNFRETTTTRLHFSLDKEKVQELKNLFFLKKKKKQAQLVSF